MKLNLYNSLNIEISLIVFSFFGLSCIPTERPVITAGHQLKKTTQAEWSVIIATEQLKDEAIKVALDDLEKQVKS